MHPTDTFHDLAVVVDLAASLRLVIPATLCPALIPHESDAPIPVYPHAAARLGEAITAGVASVVECGPGCATARVSAEGDIEDCDIHGDDHAWLYFGSDLLRDRTAAALEAVEGVRRLLKDGHAHAEAVLWEFAAGGIGPEQVRFTVASTALEDGRPEDCASLYRYSVAA